MKESQETKQNKTKQKRLTTYLFDFLDHYDHSFLHDIGGGALADCVDGLSHCSVVSRVVVRTYVRQVSPPSCKWIDRSWFVVVRRDRGGRKREEVLPNRVSTNPFFWQSFVTCSKNLANLKIDWLVVIAFFLFVLFWLTHRTSAWMLCGSWRPGGRSCSISPPVTSFPFRIAIHTTTVWHSLLLYSTKQL